MAVTSTFVVSVCGFFGAAVDMSSGMESADKVGCIARVLFISVDFEGTVNRFMLRNENPTTR